MKKNIITVFFTLLLAFLALTALFPFVYMLLTSLKQSYSLGLDFSLVGLSFKNYNTVFKNFEFAKYFTNSVIVAVLACVLTALSVPWQTMVLRKRILWEGMPFSGFILQL